MIRPFLLVPVLLAMLLLVVSSAGMPASPDEPDSAEGAAAAIFTLKVNLDLERSKLGHCLTEYADAERRREESRDQISDLYLQIGSAVRQGESPAEGEEDLETLVTRARAAEQAEATAREDLRRLREQIAESRERIRIFQDKIADLRRVAPPEPEGLSGTWDVTLLPNGDRAVFTIRQSGTIISGEYQQEGGWRGSLQGTLVNNKVVLHRIDSKLGSSSDLEATVSTDLKSLKGSWQSRVLSDGLPSTGTWTGRKREPKKKSDVSAP